MSGSSSTKRILFFLAFSSVTEILHRSDYMGESKKGYQRYSHYRHLQYYISKIGLNAANKTVLAGLFSCLVIINQVIVFSYQVLGMMLENLKNMLVPLGGNITSLRVIDPKDTFLAQ
jgi:hypothetical protein